MILRNGGGSSKNEIFGYEKETHAFTRGWLGESDGHLLDCSSTEGVSLSLKDGEFDDLRKASATRVGRHTKVTDEESKEQAARSNGG